MSGSPCGHVLHWRENYYRCPLNNHPKHFSSSEAYAVGHKCQKDCENMSDPIPTEDLGKNFVRDQRHVDSLHDQLQEAKKFRDKSMQELAKRLAPSTGMEDGEKIGCWCSTGFREERCFVVEFKRGKYHVAERGARDVTK